MIKPIGVDISRWQHPVDWVKMEAAKPAFLVHRATIARDYIDPFFMSSMAECQNRRIPYSAYHVVRCDYSAQSQMVSFISALKLAGAEKTSLPLVLDCELDNGRSPAVIAQIIYDCARILEDTQGKKPMIYSRKNWIETFIGTKQWLNEYEWWIAIYPLTENLPAWYDRIPDPPAPVELDQVKIHQYTDRGIGSNYGTTSKQIDLNWWQGDQESLDLYIAKYGGVIVPPPPQTINDRVTALEEAARAHGWNV